MRNTTLVVALGVLLGGCAETLARVTTDAAYLHEAASEYVREQHQARQNIRQECRSSVAREIQQLIEAGDEPALRAMLRSVYPPLVTMDIVNAALDDSGASVLSEPPGCG